MEGPLRPRRRAKAHRERGANSHFEWDKAKMGPERRGAAEAVERKRPGGDSLDAREPQRFRKDEISSYKSQQTKRRHECY